MPAREAAGTVRTSGLEKSLLRPSPAPRLMWPRPAAGLAAFSDAAKGAARMGVALAAGTAVAAAAAAAWWATGAAAAATSAVGAVVAPVSGAGSGPATTAPSEDVAG